MPLTFRTTSADSNSAGAASFVGIPIPFGVQDGDLVIIGIALPAAGVTVTPPDASWTQIAQTDPQQSLGIVGFWKYALNELANWVFALSASCQAAGCAIIYGNTDPYAPIEAQAVALTAASTTHNVPGIAAAQDQEEVVVLLAAGASGTYTPPGGFNFAVRKQQAGATLEVQRRSLQSAATIQGFTETFSTSTTGAALVLAVPSGFGQSSVDDARQRLLDGFPQGADELYDMTPGSGDYWKFFQAVGSLLKTFGHDLLDLLRLEIRPQSSRYKLPDWEEVFGLTSSRAAQTGTIPQRQAQLVGAFRAAAGQGSAIPTVKGILVPLFGYNPATPVQIVEASASGLRVLHQYGFASDITIPNGTSASVTFVVGDGGKASQMGAQLELACSQTSVASHTFVLTAPDGHSFTWSGGTYSAVPLKLYAQSLAGALIEGAWTLTITNNSGSSNTFYASSSLFVEGMARGQDTGGAIFHWGAYADPAHLGENGTQADLSSAFAAIKKVTFSHSVGRLLLSLWPWPHQQSGVHTAIPARCIPSKRTS